MPLRGSDEEEPPPYDDEFLFHLSRGSEFLVAGRMTEAKEALERALMVRPRDAKSQDLLAGVYFRLGVYPRAIELWSGLVAQYPDDVALHVNLGLAYLKTAQLEEAVFHLSRATTLEAGHKRAWRYLGLALWREGRLERARDAFLRGGQVSMARRMAEMLETSVPAQLGASLSVAPPPSWEASNKSARQSFVLEAIRPPRSVEASSFEEIDSTVALEEPPERWKTDDAVTLADLLEAHGQPTSPSGLVPIPSGDLVIAPADARMVVRFDRLVFAQGNIARDGAGDWIDVEPGGVARSRPTEGRRARVVRLGRDESLYVLESYVLAFEAGAGSEARSIVADAPSPCVVPMRGPARVAIELPSLLVAVSIGPLPVFVPVDRLVGWSGRIFPATTASGRGLLLSGEGTVLVDGDPQRSKGPAGIR